MVVCTDVTCVADGHLFVECTERCDESAIFTRTARHIHSAVHYCSSQATGIYPLSFMEQITLALTRSIFHSPPCILLLLSPFPLTLSPFLPFTPIPASGSGRAL